MDNTDVGRDGLGAQDELQDALALRVAGHGHVERGRHAPLDGLVQVLRTVGRACTGGTRYKTIWRNTTQVIIRSVS